MDQQKKANVTSFDLTYYSTVKEKGKTVHCASYKTMTKCQTTNFPTEIWYYIIEVLTSQVCLEGVSDQFISEVAHTAQNVPHLQRVQTE